MGLLELVRYPSFSIPALLFPAAIFLVLARAYEQPPETRMAGFAAVAILGIVFFQFGVGIAAERVSPWESYVRTLPVVHGRVSEHASSRASRSRAWRR
jgi:ABC-2 type transport system permease protein